MRGWLGGVAAYFAVIVVWAVALPVNGTYDEKQHIVRAYAVATGQLSPVGTAVDTLGRRTEAFRAPRSLLPVGTSVDCTWWQPPRPASCQRFTADRTLVLTPTVAGHYSPVYYAAVGLPLRWSPDRAGVIAARLVSALLSALLLGTALWLAVRSGRRILVAAVALATTPTALNLAGAVNPNGLEIAAGILTATALATLLVRRPGPPAGPAPAGTPADRTPADRERATSSAGRDGARSPVDRGAIVAAGVGAFLLLTVRQLGPALLALIVGAFLLLAGRDRLRDLAGRRDVRWVLGGAVTAGLVTAVSWLLYSGSAVPMSPARPVPRLTTGETATELLTHRLPFCLKQMVAQFSYGEVDVSPVAVVGWYLMVGVLVVGGLRRAGGRARFAVAGLGVACLAVLVAMDLHYLPRYGWFSQGRYVLPAAVGVVLFAAVASGWDNRRLAWTLTAATVPIQVYAVTAVATGFQ